MKMRRSNCKPSSKTLTTPRRKSRSPTATAEAVNNAFAGFAPAGGLWCKSAFGNGAPDKFRWTTGAPGFRQAKRKSGSANSNQDSFASANSSEVAAMKVKLGVAFGILALSFAIASPAWAQGQAGAGTGSALRD